MLDMYKTSIPSDIEYVGSTVEEIICYLLKYCSFMDECILFELKVTLNELILNAIKHGNMGDQRKFVKIAAGISKNDNVFFLIEDEGEGYDYTYLLRKNQSLDDLIEICDMKETGRGMFIIANLCDKIRFNKKGNRIMVSKKLYKS